MVVQRSVLVSVCLLILIFFKARQIGRTANSFHPNGTRRSIRSKHSRGTSASLLINLPFLRGLGM